MVNALLAMMNLVGSVMISEAVSAMAIPTEPSYNNGHRSRREGVVQLLLNLLPSFCFLSIYADIAYGAGERISFFFVVGFYVGLLLLFCYVSAVRASSGIRDLLVVMFCYWFAVAASATPLAPWVKTTFAAIAEIYVLTISSG